jgi:hypothetical protein
VEADCADGADDDGDGDTDCADSDCADAASCVIGPGVERLCNDGADDDGDGDTDCADSDCADAVSCAIRPETELLCDNARDDDEDGFTDCDDADCRERPNCSVAPPEETDPLCDNGVDDDDDGDTDCADAGCLGSDFCGVVVDDEREDLCRNGFDDDYDGDTDCDDPGCCDYPACTELGFECGSCPRRSARCVATGPTTISICSPTAWTRGAAMLPPAPRPSCEVVPSSEIGLCQNQLDDDEDGAADCEDLDCCATEECFSLGLGCGEPLTEFGYCANGLDDDQDEMTDCADLDCAADPVCTVVEICSVPGVPTFLGTFEEDTDETDPSWNYAGRWSTFTDESGSISPAPGAFTTEKPGANGSNGALHLQGDAVPTGANVGARVTLDASEAGSTAFVDLTGSTGLALYARIEVAMDLWVAVVTAATLEDDGGGTCSGGCGDHFATTITLAGGWACYWLPWSDFAQRSTAGTGNRDSYFRQSVAIEFHPVSPTKAFDFWLDDVAIVWEPMVDGI